MDSQVAPPALYVQAYVAQLLNAGDTLVNLVDALVDALTANDSTREDASGEVIAMLMGTVAVRLPSVSEDDFVRATELLERTVDVVIADLRRAERLARRRERSRGGGRGRRGTHRP